ncbi:MAG TPA: EAL domain-containing protein [Gammaproteobacteria bacterium]|nr:EAL domain-containing protein [Gammaproteobacteria bacterium]
MAAASGKSISYTTLLNATAALSGQHFFNALAANLTALPNIDTAFVAVYAMPGRDHLKLVAGAPEFWIGSEKPWPIRQTPAELLKNIETVFYADAVAAEFPHDAWLAHNRIRGYLGLRIPASDGTALGVLVIASRRPLARSRELLAALQALAHRAATEIERWTTPPAPPPNPAPVASPNAVFAAGADRAAFIGEVAQALRERSPRHEHNLAVLFIDIDRFRLVNDVYGHRNGDMLLAAIARRLHDGLRPRDRIARNGGDEFWVLLRDIRSREEAIVVADRLHHLFREPFEIGGYRILVTASIGIAIEDIDCQTPEELMRDADVAMYAARSGDRSAYATYKPEMSQPLADRLALESELRVAAAEDQFELHYQPLIELASGRVTGLEALLRWRHPRRGVLAPVEFLDAAVSTGLILPIGWRALETTCLQLREWQALAPAFENLIISFNLINPQYSQWVLPQRAARALEVAKIRGECLQLELAGADLAADADIAEQILTRLKGLGIRLQLDDFGVGHSSLASLRRFPFDSFKVDGSLVRGMLNNRRDAEMVRHLAGLASGLGLEPAAGGVETREQADELRALGFVTAQGFLFAKPMPADAVTAFLSRSAPGARQRQA